MPNSFPALRILAKLNIDGLWLHCGNLMQSTHLRTFDPTSCSLTMPPSESICSEIVSMALTDTSLHGPLCHLLALSKLRSLEMF